MGHVPHPQQPNYSGRPAWSSIHPVSLWTSTRGNISASSSALRPAAQIAFLRHAKIGYCKKKKMCLTWWSSLASSSGMAFIYTALTALSQISSVRDYRIKVRKERTILVPADDSLKLYVSNFFWETSMLAHWSGDNALCYLSATSTGSRLAF